MIPDILTNKNKTLPIFTEAGAKKHPFPQKTLCLTNNDIDTSGVNDCTLAIQSKIDELEKIGGGVLSLPAGRLRVSVPDGKTSAIHINSSNIVLIGAAPLPNDRILHADRAEDYEKYTHIICTTNLMRKRSIIKIGDTNEGFDNENDSYATSVKIVKDILQNDKIIVLSNPSDFKVDDMIIIRADWTKAFIKEKRMTRYWKPSTTLGQSVWRKIVAINGNTITLDIPIGFLMKARDNLRAYKCEPKVTNVIIQDICLSNKISSKKKGLGSYDYVKKGTLAYDLHASYQILFNDCMNCSATRVQTSLSNNKGSASGGLLLRKSRSLTINDCHFCNAVYRGAGGNGYGITIQSGDCMILQSSTYRMRHGIAFRGGNTNGNVINRYQDKNSSFPVDYHMHLSSANLIEDSDISGSFFEAKNRGAYGSSGVRHGQGAEYCVYWNIRGKDAKTRDNKLIKTGQNGTGIVVGTSGARYKIENISKRDYVEMIGEGKDIEPQSLYQYQYSHK